MIICVPIDYVEITLGREQQQNKNNMNRTSSFRRVPFRGRATGLGRSSVELQCANAKKQPVDGCNAQIHIRALPKVELHVHLEGTIARPENTDANFMSLGDFLGVYDKGMEKLQTARDFHDVTLAYLRRAADDEVRHVEMFFDPEPHMERGIAAGAMVDGIEEAIDTASRELSTPAGAHITANMIFSWQRNRGVRSAEACLQAMAPYVGRVVGVGTSSDYVASWPEQYAPLYHKAESLGFRKCCHAGELTDGSDGDWSGMERALKLIDPERIDHGYRCVADPSGRLLEAVVEKQVHLTVCPLSNARLRCINSLAEHPLRRLIDSGCNISLNSDDPGYVSDAERHLTEVFALCSDQFELSLDELANISKSAARAAFISEDRLLEIEQAIDTWTVQVQQQTEP